MNKYQLDAIFPDSQRGKYLQIIAGADGEVNVVHGEQVLFTCDPWLLIEALADVESKAKHSTKMKNTKL